MVDLDVSQPYLARGRPLFRFAGVNASAAMLAGLAAGGAALIALLMFSTSLYDESAWKLPRMLAAVIAGRGALEPDDEFSVLLVPLGIMVELALALGYSYALALLVKDMPEAAAPWIGMGFGVALYFVDLYGFTRAFEWFTPLRTLDTLAAHVLFGIVAATTYRHLASPAER